MEGFIYCVCDERGLAERVELIEEKSDDGGGLCEFGGGGVQRPVMPAIVPYMMPQEDNGLAIWQVQADWQYWRTVW